MPQESTHFFPKGGGEESNLETLIYFNFEATKTIYVNFLAFVHLSFAGI